MSTQTILTPAELELIENNRKQAALAAEQKELQQKIELEGKIAIQLETIERDARADRAQLTACHKFLIGFDSEWTVQTVTRKENYVVKEYGADKPTIVWSQTAERTTGTIVHSSKKFTVVVEFNSSKKEYIMCLKGADVDFTYGRKELKNPKTIIAKVGMILQSIKNKIAQESKKLNALEQAYADLNAKYPSALVSSKSEWERSIYSKNGGEVINVLILTFDNGIVLEYKVCLDGRLSRRSIKLNGIAESKFMDALINISK